MLGYDAASGFEIRQEPAGGLSSAAWLRLTAEPRRYGFHATLKAPFRLAPGCRRDGLVAALEAHAAGARPLGLGRLEVACLGPFVAVQPVARRRSIASYVQEIVEAFEGFRAPLTADERARRNPERLTPRQVELLDRFGYPYVAEQFRFHMTLTGFLAETDLREAVRADLARRYQEMVGSGETMLDRLCLFEQPDRESRFRIVAAVPVGQPPAR